MPIVSAVIFVIFLVVAGCTPKPPPSPPVPVVTPAPAPVTADQVLVLKSERRLLLMHENEVLHSFPIALGRNPEGPKRQEGDGRTPEGFYVLLDKKADSAFYRSIRISYPNEGDVAQARARGMRPGGQIMIHGLPNGQALTDPREALAVDWTEGCIAVTNETMDVIWRSVSMGTAIVIRP